MKQQPHTTLKTCLSEGNCPFSSVRSRLTIVNIGIKKKVLQISSTKVREKPRGYLTGKLYKGNVSVAIQALSGTQHTLKNIPLL